MKNSTALAECKRTTEHQQVNTNKKSHTNKTQKPQAFNLHLIKNSVLKTPSRFFLLFFCLLLNYVHFVFLKYDD